MQRLKDCDFTENEQYEKNMNNEEIDISLLDKEDELDDEIFINNEKERYYKNTWREAEKYKEMQELQKLINDDLYSYNFDEDILDSE